MFYCLQRFNKVISMRVMNFDLLSDGRKIPVDVMFNYRILNTLINVNLNQLWYLYIYKPSQED